MGSLDKLLRKFPQKERIELERLVERIIRRNLTGLDCKKLKGFRELFRVRKGATRVLFELTGSRGARILTIERRSEGTYKF